MQQYGKNQNERSFLSKLSCRCPAGNSYESRAFNLLCSVCGNIVHREDGIYRSIELDVASNRLENYDYDSLHSVGVESGIGMAQAFLDHMDLKSRRADVLELGCGTGLLTVGLAEHSQVGECVSVDISRTFLLRTQAKLLRHSAHNDKVFLVCADVNDLPFRPQSFDAVIGNSFLHHIYDYERLLRAVKDTLRPDGVALFSEPCQQGKSLVGFFLSLIVHWDATFAKPVFTDEERKRIRDVTQVLLREKHHRHRPELKLQKEDKHIFKTSQVKRVAERLGFSSLSAINTGPVNNGYRAFVEATLKLGGIQKNLDPFGFLFEEFQDKYLDLMSDETETPHQLLVFRSG